jgi:hypothetical protein
MTNAGIRSYPYIAGKNQPANAKSWSALSISIQAVHIFKFSLNIKNGFVQNGRQTSPFKCGRVN